MRSDFEEYTVYQDEGQFRLLQNAGLPWSLYVGVLGMPGMSTRLSPCVIADLWAGKTAYYSWKEYAHAQQVNIPYLVCRTP